MIKVEEVKRINGRAEEVIISIDDIELTFHFINDKVELASKKNYGVSRLNDYSKIWVPKESFSKALKIAAAIFKEKSD